MTPFQRLNGSEPLPEWLELWIVAVVGDLQGDDPVDFRLGLVEYIGIRAVWYLEDDGSGQQIYSEEELAFAPQGSSFYRDVIAERLQEAFIESDAAYAQPRPQCPGHPHPADYVEGGSWRCPATGASLGPVGRLDTLVPPPT